MLFRIIPFFLAFVLTAADGPFLVKPYLQIGDSPGLSSNGSLLVMWEAPDENSKWGVEWKSGDGNWSAAAAVSSTRVAVRGIEPHRLYRALLEKLPVGGEFDYHVLREDHVVFEAHARSRKSGDTYRFAVFGDCGAGTPAQREVAYQTFVVEPDFVFIPGDIVYTSGRISEYRKKYFPVYNADKASPAVGAPLIRSIPFIAAPGNHDTARIIFRQKPDGLAYFLYWAQPLNGPVAKPGANAPRIDGSESDHRAFLAAAGPAYPRMANFSFDYGGAHWLVLDANPYVDWTDPALRNWVKRDLAAARGATWRFAGFHQPGFNSAKRHFGDQWMRGLSDLFEAGGVDVVFAGHVHNYQRSYPLKFHAKERPAKRKVDGTWTLDKSFDGITKTTPDGIIYLVTGAGGAGLYNREQQDNPASWQDFTCKFFSRANSLTVVDAEGRKLTFRQITTDGHEVDRFVVTK